MSDYAKGLSSVSRFDERWRVGTATKKNRVLDDRDKALGDAIKNVEARSDSDYPSVVSMSKAVGWLALIQNEGLTITGANFVGSAEKASGATADSTGKITFTAVLPGEQTITVTIEDDGTALAISANASAGTIAITHGSGGSGAGGASTAAEIVAAVNADATAKYMVDAATTTAGDIDADETVSVTTTDDDPGTLPVLQIGATTVDGTTSKTGITGFSDTTITFDFDGRTLTSGSVQMLRLWVDDVLVFQCPLVADSEPWDVEGSYFGLSSDFELDAGGTLPAPLAKDVQTANITGDYLADTAGGVYALTHDGTSEAQAGQVTWGDHLLLDPTKGPIFECRLKINFAGAAFSADQRAVWGLCSAHANAEDGLDAVASNAWFRIEGAALDILVEGDDGTTDDDDNDSTYNLVDNSYRTFRIDMSDLSAVKFYVDGFVSSATVDVDQLSASNLLQPIFCIQRDAGTEAEVLAVDWYRVRASR